MSGQRKTQTKPKKEQNFVIVDFLDIDTDKITFNAPKDNNYGGSYVTLRYGGKQLYVRYDARICPFGLSTNTQDVSKTKDKGKYPKDEKVTGYSTSISLQKDYENDPYYEKARELDEFFIEKCIENSVLWGLGGSKTVKVDRASIAGYDDKGDKGKWKRILKYAYKVDKQTKERIYQEYAPRLDFGIITASAEDVEGEDGLLHAEATFKTRFFDADAEPIPNVNTNNIDDILPNWSRIGIMAMWSSISLGTYGASLKPKAQQVRVFPSEGLNNDECLLDGEDEDDFNDEVPDALGDMAAPKVERVTKRTTTKPATPEPEPEETEEVEEGEEVEVEEEEVQEEEVEEDELVNEEELEEEPEEEPEPEPEPDKKPARRTARRVVKKN